mgnify:CR=1 FL=1
MNNDIIHHDLKPLNIVYNEEQNRLNFIDFGFMTKISSIKEQAKQVKPFLDKTIGRLLSRKLMVWMTATYFMLVGGALTSEDWVAVSLAYIGIQGIADIAATWKHGK